jgi:hypothetical protein
MDIGSMLAEVVLAHVHGIHLTIEQEMAQTKTPRQADEGHPIICRSVQISALPRGARP